MSKEGEKKVLKGGGGAEGGAPTNCHETTSDARDEGIIDCESVHSSVRTVTDSLKRKLSTGSGQKSKQTRVEYALNNTYLGRAGGEHCGGETHHRRVEVQLRHKYSSSLPKI